ncbi:MAG: Fe-S cluster assembly protein SufD [cyanobacterium endosymbiont of Rhopalodia musculus]|uniref:Fe-S cluster assembly protein SufD n=1 Tax=cyanobacterium endosymbiont of Epithemia clementina EcSB TaxID=3034674 RepID=UPI0024813389|nr:Fe-S cluster assembly protein SufD [cyanobacterium endosymbiont of Epithemia clementina EcSB]WGT67315.1 Fe-S cluster assembly protein SufD [cyanobacterium endosymbiont of Epithemia clementina EcSB]
MTTSTIKKSVRINQIWENILLGLSKECQSQEAVGKLQFLSKLREDAVSESTRLNFPTKQDEDWRFVDLSELSNIQFKPTRSATTIFPDNLSSFILPETQKSQLIFVNGEYAPELSNLSALPKGVYVGSLMGLPESKKEKVVHYLGKNNDKKDFFTLINTADLYHVAIVWVDPNIIVDVPVDLLFLSVPTDCHSLIQPRVLIIAETGSSVTLVENYTAIAQECSDIAENKPYLVNGVTEIFLEDNARINHSRIQRELRDSFHIGKTTIIQNKESRYICNDISLGAKLSRHTLKVFQQGKQTETNLSGLTMVGNLQISDTHSAVYLNYPYGIIHQLHKCIIDDHAHGIFNGKISVPKPAQLTNANQLNRNLLLSSKARIDTKPELQITADNVKCSHGATISQLESDELFYLQSRGLNQNDARNLLIDAFATEILDQLPLKSLRQRLTQCVACRTLEY